MPSLSHEGLLYVATGIQYLEEAALSASVSRHHIKGRPIAVVTDQPDAATRYGVFDYIIPHSHPSFSYRDKIEPLIYSPFLKTLYLDSDAFLVDDVNEFFLLCNSSIVSVAHAPVRFPTLHRTQDTPLIFPEHNTGVILYRRCPKQVRLFRRWLQLYDQYGDAWDQFSFRTALWESFSSGLSLYVLPPEANLRTTKPWVVGKGSPVYVIHGRIPPNEIEIFSTYLNSDINRFRTSSEWYRLHPDSQIRIRTTQSS